MKAKKAKLPSLAQRKYELAVTQFDEERRELHNHLAFKGRQVAAQEKQITGLKAIVSDQQLNITILLDAIRRGNLAIEIDGKQAAVQVQGQAQGQQANWVHR